jgi:predicted MFS family arabinose efflux permease
VLEEVSIEPVKKEPIGALTVEVTSHNDMESVAEKKEDKTLSKQGDKIIDASFSDRLLTEETRPPTAESISGSESITSKNVVYAAGLDYWNFLKNLNMVLCVLGIMFGGFAYFNQLFLFPLYAHELGYSKLDGATLVSFTGFSEIVTRLLVSTTLDKKWLNKTLLVVSCSLICSVLGLLLTLHAPHWYVLVTYALILGAIGGTMIPLAIPILTEYVRMDRISSATGLFLFAMGMAYATGPLLLSKYSNAELEYSVVDIVFLL